MFEQIKKQLAKENAERNKNTKFYIENGADIKYFTLYDVSISELAEFIKTVTEE